jgi:hypothetical protein
VSHRYTVRINKTILVTTTDYVDVAIEALDEIDMRRFSLCEVFDHKKGATVYLRTWEAHTDDRRQHYETDEASQ